MENQNTKISKLFLKNDIYELKVGNMCVEIEYKDNQKSFNECMINVLKQKIK